MRKLIAILALTALASVSFAEAWTLRTVTMRDSITNITADTSLASINTGQADWVQVSVELNTLGGSGTYAPLILTSIDGTLWDTLRSDTLSAALQNTVYTLSLYQSVFTGAGGNTANGAATAGVALSNYLKVYMDEVAASSGSQFVIKAFIRERKYVR